MRTAHLLILLMLAAPSEGEVLRVALGSCAHQDKTQRVWQAVRAWDPDLFVHLGDAIYADTRDSVVMREAYGKVAENPNFIAVREAVPFVATWDDHDYGENDAGASYPMAVPAEREFERFWGDAHLGREGQRGVYGSRTLAVGSRVVRVIVLDTRSFRSDWTKGERGKRRYRPDPDPAKTMLGSEQWSWLERELRVPADLRIIASSIQVVNDEHGWESWGNFPAERARLMRLIRETAAMGVVILSGDRHFTELSVQAGAVGYDLYDFTASGLTQTARTGHLVPNSRRVGKAVAVQNFGGVTIDFSRGEVVFEAFDVEGVARFREAAALEDLTAEEGR